MKEHGQETKRELTATPEGLDSALDRIAELGLEARINRARRVNSNLDREERTELRRREEALNFATSTANEVLDLAFGQKFAEEIYMRIDERATTDLSAGIYLPRSNAVKGDLLPPVKPPPPEKPGGSPPPIH